MNPHTGQALVPQINISVCNADPNAVAQAVLNALNAGWEHYACANVMHADVVTRGDLHVVGSARVAQTAKVLLFFRRFVPAEHPAEGQSLRLSPGDNGHADGNGRATGDTT